MSARTSLFCALFSLFAVAVLADPPEDRHPPAKSLMHVLSVDRQSNLVVSLRVYAPDNAGVAKAVQENPTLRRIELASSVHVTPEGLTPLTTLESLREVQFLHRNEQVTDEAIAVLARIPQLQVLDGAGEVTDRGLEHLKSVRQLRELTVGGPGITNRGMETLAANNPGIRTLDLSGAAITDEGLKFVGRIAGLRNLTLYATKTTDAGLSHLRGLSDLESLEPADTITDDGLAHLKDLKRLYSLDLMYCREVTDRGAEVISQISSLRRLELLGTGITDEGLASLGRLKNLEDLGVSDTRVTGRGFEKWPDSPPLSHLRLATLELAPSTIDSLARFKDLRSLWIYQTPIERDGHWRRLAALKSLKRLTIDLRQALREELQKSLPSCEIMVDDLEVDYPEDNRNREPRGR